MLEECLDILGGSDGPSAQERDGISGRQVPQVGRRSGSKGASRGGCRRLQDLPALNCACRAISIHSHTKKCLLFRKHLRMLQHVKSSPDESPKHSPPERAMIAKIMATGTLIMEGLDWSKPAKSDCNCSAFATEGLGAKDLAGTQMYCDICKLITYDLGQKENQTGSRPRQCRLAGHKQ